MNYSPVSPLKVWWCLFVLFQITKAIENVSAPIHTELVCGWNTLEAKCGFGEVIHFIRANYGRTSLLPCNDDNLPWDVDCDFTGSNEIVKQRCDKKWSCKVPATTSIFGDPCVGTEKYLEMDFQCKPGGPLLLFADSDTGIQAIDIETLDDYDVKGEIKKIKDITAFDFLYHTKTIVWTDNRTHRIFSAPIESRGEITTVSSKTLLPTALAVDWIHNKLYWADFGKKSILVANLDGSWEKTLFETGYNRLDCIVVDPIQGWMFWIDGGDEPKIERAGMDGSHRSAIIYTDIRMPYSIAMDLSYRKIYWIDVSTREVYTANYDGKRRRTLFTSSILQGAASLNHFKGQFYWKRSEKVYRFRIGASLFATPILNRRVWGNLGNIKIFHNAQQPEGPNRCGTNNGGCSYLCLPTPQLHGISTPDSKPYSCVCPNHVGNCSNQLTENVSDDQYDEFNSSSHVVAMTKLLALIVLVGLVCY